MPRGYGNFWLSNKLFEDCLDFQMSQKLLNRTTIIQNLINKMGYKVYVEIGLEEGINFFQIKAPIKIGIDPHLRILGGYYNTQRELFYEVTPDQLFESLPEVVAKNGIDIAFIDGLHTYEQSLRDVLNCLKYLNQNGIIVIHDCLPDSPATAAPTLEEAKRHPQFSGARTGEVYKTILHLRSTRPDLFVAVVNCDWGVGIVKRGQPESMIKLTVDEIKSMTFEEFNIRKDELLNLKPPSWLYEYLLKT